MKRVGCITAIITSYVVLYFIGFMGSYFYINSTKTKPVVAVPSQNYSEIDNELRNLREEEKSYLKKRKAMYPKEVFLTFDDGPSSNNTLAVLNILKSNNIKATFFVVGNQVEQHAEIVKQLNDNGMCILAHSYSHDYSIYRSVSSYFEDLEACNSAIEKATGRKGQLYTRLPGGSDNAVATRAQMQNIRSSLKEKYVYYVDWNVSSADAACDKVPTERIKENVINQCSGKKLAVVLMHDSYPKTTTVEALPAIIKYLKSQGFEFRTFDDITPEEEKAMIKERVVNR